MISNWIYGISILQTVSVYLSTFATIAGTSAASAVDAKRAAPARVEPNFMAAEQNSDCQGDSNERLGKINGNEGGKKKEEELPSRGLLLGSTRDNGEKSRDRNEPGNDQRSRGHFNDARLAGSLAQGG